MKKAKSLASSTTGPVVKDASPPASTPSEAQRMAATILEVLAGVQSPPVAAEALKVSLPRYYQLEARALGGLLGALGPRPRGKQPSLEKRIQHLEKELEAARRACARQEALVRLTQRTLGLPPPTKPKPAAVTPHGKGRRRRKPMVRALRAAHVLRQQADSAAGVESATSLQTQSTFEGAEETRP